MIGRFIFIDSRFRVYHSNIDPEDNRDIFLTEHELLDRELIELVELLQNTIDQTIIQLSNQSKRIKKGIN